MNHSSSLNQRGTPCFGKTATTLPRSFVPIARKLAPQFKERGVINGCPSINFQPFLPTSLRLNSAVPGVQVPFNSDLHPNFRHFHSSQGVESCIFPFYCVNAGNGQAPIVSIEVKRPVNLTMEKSGYGSFDETFPNSSMAENIRMQNKITGGKKFHHSIKIRKSRWDKPRNIQAFNLQQTKSSANISKFVQNPVPLNENTKNIDCLKPETSSDPLYQPIINVTRNVVISSGIQSPTFLTSPPVFTAPIPHMSDENICQSTVNLENTVKPTAFKVPNVFQPASVLVTSDNNKTNDTLVEPNDVSFENTMKHVFDDKKYDYGNIAEAHLHKELDTFSPDITANNLIKQNIKENKSKISSSVDVGRTINDCACMKCSVENIDKSGVEMREIVNKNEVISCSQEEPTDKRPVLQKVDKSRPVSSTPVPGTTWCVVWTGDGKVFFYDSYHRLSVWECPEVLKDRADVKKLTKSPPIPSEISQMKSACIEDNKKFKTNGHEMIVTNLISEQCSEKDICSKKCENESLETKPEHERERTSFSENVDAFCQMLKEKNISAFSTWEKELHRIVFDPRYLLLCPNERKKVFEMYLRERRAEEKNDRIKRQQEIRELYRELLIDANVTSKTRFSDFVRRYSKEKRFTAIEKRKEREILFEEFVNEIIKNEKKAKLEEKEHVKRFTELLKEQKLGKDVAWTCVEKNISKDGRFKAISSDSLRRKLFEDYISQFYPDSVLERQERVKASIRAREEEVMRNLSVHLEKRDRQQELHKYESIVSGFKALVVDLIQCPDMTWREAKKIFKKDSRWDSVKELETNKCEKIFKEHISFLDSKKKQLYHSMLDGIPDIRLTTTWKEVKSVVQKNSKCSRFSTCERKCEKEFEEYMREKVRKAIIEFKELLRETKLITHESKDLIKHTNHLEMIEKVLQNDKRYLILEELKHEREAIILSYIDKLHCKRLPSPAFESTSKRTTTYS